MAKQRVAILGGGLSGLVTAFNLTQPDQLDRFDVTIYQYGWRLGGKCATGRNAEHGDRIEEHGLHVFMGQYDNAFHMVQQLYKEADTCPFDNWRDAFTQQPAVALMEKVGDDWVPWQLEAPIFPGTPGEGESPSIWERALQMLDWMVHQMFHVHHDVFHASGGSIPEKIIHGIQHLISDILAAVEFTALNAGLALVHLAQKTINALHPDSGRHSHAEHKEIAGILKKLREWIKKEILHVLDGNNDLRRLWIMFDMALTSFIGGLEDGLLFDPDANLDRVNRLDFKEWLRSHGCTEIAVESAIIRGLYDLIFGYKRGDWKSDGDTEAGTMFLSLMNTARYRGSLIWKFNTATGEMVIAPLYEVLKSRGVKFEFFSRVDALVPSATGNWIGEVKIGRQVNLKDGSYEPLRVLPSGQKVWPDRPRYEQIREGKALKDSEADLESFWTDWKDRGEPLSLKMGEDYDWLVLAIPPAAHPYICRELMNQNPAWNDMVHKIETTATQSLQTWMPQTVSEMGWKYSTMVGAFDRSGLDTWSDISEILPTENWPKDSPLKSEQIACGPFPCPQFPPVQTDRDYPLKAYAQVKKSAETFLNEDGWRFWPDAFKKGEVGPINSIYNRVNVDPSERYTLTVKDSSRYRFKTNGSGYGNLFLTGDWIDNGQNQGSFEATTISGKLASKAMSGFPKTIFRIDADKYIAKTPMKPVPPARAPFVTHGGLVTFPGPLSLKDTTMWAFLLEADLGKMEAFCDKVFTVPSGGAVKVLPLAPFMMMSVVDIRNGTFPEASEMGFSKERELAFWMPVVRVKEKNGHYTVTHFDMVMPYLGLNNSAAIASGREIFGYWKQQGWLTLPGDEGNADGSILVDLFSSKTLTPQTEEQRNRWVSLTSLGKKESPVLKGIKNIEDAVAALFHHIEPDITHWRPGLGFTLEFLGDVLTGHIPQLFLKQFRDISDGNFACYQAITEAVAHIDNFQSLPHFTEYALNIEALASSPVATDFGINPRQNVLGVSFTMDFGVQPGKTLWQA